MPTIAVLYDMSDDLRIQYPLALKLVGADVRLFTSEDFAPDGAIPEGAVPESYAPEYITPKDFVPEAHRISRKNLDSVLKELCACDGLLISGGKDVNPALYGQEPIPACGKPLPVRDNADMKLFEHFLPTGKPILGICRGEQAMNVFFGGTLHQDIKPIQKCTHADLEAKDRGIHPVTLAEGSGLAKIFGKTQVWVNSLHHQAVDEMGTKSLTQASNGTLISDRGLVATAWSPDGFIEGIEVPDHPFCIGVQWHPEHMAATDKTQRKLFEAFVEACAKAARQ